MSLSRRGFIGTLLAGFGAAAVPKQLLWQPIPEAVEIVRPDAVLGLTQITQQMLREITRLAGVSVPMLDADKIGRVDQGLVLNHQYNVAMELATVMDANGLDCERYIRPAAEQFVSRLGHLKGCGRLEIPSYLMQGASVTDTQTGLSLRGLAQYVIDPYDADPYYMLRFDMLVSQ